MNPTYVFKSERLGFRNWVNADIEKMIVISGNQEVMEHFPSTAPPENTKAFIIRMQEMYERTGFCYFAVDRLDSSEFIGFIGLAEQDFDGPFCPCIDIGWRLSPQHLNFGFASEGAKACLDFGHNQLGINQIMSIAPEANLKSVGVMKKIGMTEVLKFDHPLLINYARLVNCVCYVSENKQTK
jgi:RimJ/RimL family protein N-acetyltransferase